MQTQYYAGWDGGGTKTLCRVLYQDGTAPQPFTAGALNPNGTVAGQCEATVADLLRNMAALPGGLDACRMLCFAGHLLQLGAQSGGRAKAGIQRGGAAA